MRRGVALLIIGLGGGVLLGSAAGDVLRWPAVGVVWLGIVLLAWPGRRPTRAVPAAPAEGLGERVEQILELANQQAEDHIRAAREEAARIVSDARGH